MSIIERIDIVNLRDIDIYEYESASSISNDEKCSSTNQCRLLDINITILKDSEISHGESLRDSVNRGLEITKVFIQKEMKKVASRRNRVSSEKINNRIVDYTSAKTPSKPDNSLYVLTVG